MSDLESREIRDALKEITKAVNDLRVHMEKLSTQIGHGSKRFDVLDAGLKEVNKRLDDEVKELGKTVAANRDEMVRIATSQKLLLFAGGAVVTILSAIAPSILGRWLGG